MNMRKIFLLLFLGCIFFVKISLGQGFLKANGKEIVDGSGQNVLLRGIGLGGWMVQEGYMLHLNKDGQQHKIKERIEAIIGADETAAFYKAWLSNHTTKSDIDSLHAWGFNSVRLPMHFNLFTLPVEAEPEPGKNTWLITGFELTDSLVSWCKSDHMYVILDLHAAPGGQGNDLNISDRDGSKPSLWQNEANKLKTIALWQRLASRYANETTVGGYDLLNEPNWGFEDTAQDRNGLAEKTNAPLKQLLMDITTAIRAVDKNHMIIIEGNGWGNNYRGMLGPWDPNMVLSFHKYWNYNDQASIQHILDTRDKYNVPVWLGESGENSNTWFTEAIRLLEKNNIGWSWWPLKKLGNNNPLQIKSNAGYDSLVAYWNGKRSNPPSAPDVYRALMQLAADTKCERNIVHRDVVDAMMRQPFSNETKPFKQVQNLKVTVVAPESVVDVGGIEINPGKRRSTQSLVIEAADYDLGINGQAYYDKDTANYWISAGKPSEGNRGHVYRNDGVDIYADSTQPGTYYVGHIEDGEWLQYTIFMSGKVDLILHVAALNKGGLVSISVDGNVVSKNISVPATGGELNWKELSIRKITLSPGKHRLRVIFPHGGFNFKGVEIVKVM